jgi:hypothetical protein
LTSFPLSITLLFFVIILSGAIKACKNPDRYGPRRGHRVGVDAYPYNFDDPRLGGGPTEAQGRQTRTAGLARYLAAFSYLWIFRALTVSFLLDRAGPSSTPSPSFPSSHDPNDLPNNPFLPKPRLPSLDMKRTFPATAPLNLRWMASRRVQTHPSLRVVLLGPEGRTQYLEREGEERQEGRSRRGRALPSATLPRQTPSPHPHPTTTTKTTSLRIPPSTLEIDRTRPPPPPFSSLTTTHLLSKFPLSPLNTLRTTIRRLRPRRRVAEDSRSSLGPLLEWEEEGRWSSWKRVRRGVRSVCWTLRRETI